MSYDLSFWRYKEGVYLDNNAVYVKGCEEETVDGLEDLPIDETFLSWEKHDKCLYENINGEGAFELYTATQFIIFSCKGMTGDDMNLIMEIMYNYECPLYDPQVSERYDKP